MVWVIGIIAFAFILGLIVLIHEGGHFIMAKRAGIMCYEFAIGMGPVLYQVKKGETTYSIRAIPLGGFVSMAGEEIESNMLHGYFKCQLVFENDKVSTIIVDEKKFSSALPIYTIVKSDLVGTKEELDDELYIDVKNEKDEEIRFIVKRDAQIAFPKKQTFQIAPFNRNFINKTVWQRFLAIFAGPAMNFVLAILVFFILGFCRGYNDPSVTFIDNVEPNTPSYEAGLRNGDEILYMGTKDLSLVSESEYFTEWNDISKTLLACATGENKDYQGYLNIIYKRDGEIYKTVAYPNAYINTIGVSFVQSKDNNNLTIGYSNVKGIENGSVLIGVNDVIFNNRTEALNYFYSDASQENFKYQVIVEQDGERKTVEVSGLSIQAYLDNGVVPANIQLSISGEYQRNLLKNLYMPFVETWNNVTLVFKTLKLLVSDKSVGFDDLSGPIGILDATVSILDQKDADGNVDVGGICLSLLSWVGMLSVNIGLLNLLPIPALDGCRLLFLGYEIVTGKKTNAKVENIIHTVGLVALMILFVFVAFQDVLRLFG
ncbi:MAG: site-2 protease family protein [Bacilli bacterium]|nr:site-2 protease family protein [Bacilli bacterium]